MAIEDREECANARALRTTQGRTRRRERMYVQRPAEEPLHCTAEDDCNCAEQLEPGPLALTCLIHSVTVSQTHSRQRRRGLVSHTRDEAQRGGWHAPRSASRHSRPPPLRSPHDTQPTAGETVPAIHRESELEREKEEATGRWRLKCKVSDPPR